MMRRWFGAFLALALLVAFARADFICLKDGRIVEGHKLTRVEGGITITYENGEIFVPEALIGDVMIEGEALAPPANAEEQEQVAKGMVRFEKKWMSVKSRDALLKKRLEKRLKDLEVFKAHSEWRDRYQVKSKNFDFEHTLPPDVFENYRELMEAYFAQFCRDWKISPPKGMGRLRVCLYSNYSTMMQTGGAGGGVLGYFLFYPHFELNFFHERLDVAFSQEVMFHECNHYLQKLLDVDFRMPHFPGESLAEYYGASKWDPATKKLTTGLILEGRLVEVQDDIARGEMMDLRKLITTEGMYAHYNWGWSLVHFLMNDKRYTAKFQKFIMALPTAKEIKRELNSINLKAMTQADVLVAFMHYLDIKDDAALKQMEQEWHTYVKGKLELVTARGKEEAAKEASNNGRYLRAKRLFKEAIDAGSENPMTFHRYANLLRIDKKHQEASELWKKAVALDPLTGEFYWGMGQNLIGKGDKLEGERLMKLAREVDPGGSYSDFDFVPVTAPDDG